MADIGFDITNAKSSARTNRSPLRHRPLARASTINDISSPLKKRPTSTFSDSIDEAKQSFFSSTDDLLLPRAKNQKVGDQGEQSLWQSAPLFLALLPAVGGLLFHNGGSVVTDITLLTLAAIFLNWSVRLPWDWYHASQSAPSQYSLPPRDPVVNDTIIEEDGEQEQTISSPEMTAQDGNVSKPDKSGKPGKDQSHFQSDARYELRIHELLALFSCFVFPAVGAWLLHTIRGQLSRPSEGLVSNYNLTIFLLASEIRPISHLIKMIQARTLFLQRSLNPPDEDLTPINAPSLISLTSRLDDLEAHISATSTEDNLHNSKTNTAKIITEVRKALQPDLDALNRAVRRYEKRATLLTMQTESRLQDLESRMSDAITLAAAAERSSNAQKPTRGSSALTLLDWMCATVVLPVQAAWAVLSLPGRAAATMLGSMKGYVGRKVRREMKTAGKTGSAQERKWPAAARAQGRGSKKAM